MSGIAAEPLGLRRAMAASGHGLLPAPALALSCPAPAMAQLWLQAACELSGDAPDLGARLDWIQSTWQAPGEPPPPAVAVFWALQPLTTFVFPGTHYDELPERLARQVEEAGAEPLNPAEIGRLRAANAPGHAFGPALDALLPGLERRGLTVLLLEAGRFGTGIVIAPFAYACRWQGVQLGGGHSLERLPAARTQVSAPADPAPADRPRTCQETVA